MIDLSPTLENYLKGVHRLEGRDRYARVRDLARDLRVAKPAVTVALRRLAEKGLVDYRPYEPARLTAAGRAHVRQIMLRYRVLITFFGDVLGLDEKVADATACAMEHSLDPPALERLICFLAFAGCRRKGGVDLSRRFRAFIADGEEQRVCDACVQEYLQDLEDPADPRTGSG